ncbi:hydrocarbon-binding protein [Leptolyngbya sp. FACHB-261]|uniref:hydrocarbon-binding protein n=1 Tax=Leptolyngbya sp. FACHB-261 TaxID=2692806 RepID=UPI00168647E9|nr:hydrocarbon-binding protein [Leptolyngbya sp. FACHB-261]MBD2102212.1 hydrocarbon-binding protein [Leptolyngbya sp. FACHB-261]
MMTTTSVRQELGDFNSIVCFKALVVGIEDTLGKKAAAVGLIAAGRQRGKTIVEELNLAGKNADLSTLAQALNQAVGKQGTRLCIIRKIEAVGDVLRVYAAETVCSAGEPQGSDRQCTFTLGAVWGALEAALGQRYRGKHVESVLRGSDCDVFEFQPL